MPLTSSTMVELKKLGLTKEQLTKIDTLNKARPKAMTAKLSDMGFDSKAVTKLPANLQRLTKADLLSLGKWGTDKLTPAAAKVSVAEVALIRDIFGGAVAGRGSKLAMDIYCCCCPCCCAVSMANPVSIVKANTFLN